MSLLIVAAVGVGSILYSGPGARWIGNSFGGVVYVAFWCLFGLLIYPQAAPKLISGIVLGLTCGIETLQLWHPPFLQAVRSTFLGKALLGSTFVWMDFMYYFVGAAIGWYWLVLLKRSTASE